MQDHRYQRWCEAQKHEIDYIEKGKNKAWGTPHSLEYWKRFLHLENIEGKGVEVGCGPNGIYRFAPNIIGVDPIDFSDKCDNFIQGIGESLPFEDKSIDFVVCCNAVDHAMDPDKVMSEMFRVSDRVVLWVYVWPHWLSMVMKKLDPMHPYHLTQSDIKKLVSSHKVAKRYRYTFFDEHVKHVNSFMALIKIVGAHILGVRGLCLHLMDEEKNAK